MQISNNIRINLDELNVIFSEASRKLKALCSDCTYANPEFYQKMNMGFSVYGTPKEIKTFEISGNQLTITRGEMLKVLQYFPGEAREYNHDSSPISIKYENRDFDLDPFQKEAVETIASKRQGVIHAVTSAGKSLIILAAIAKIGQRALIVVHRKVLMKQFLDDIDKYIRTPDGKKIKPGIIGDGEVSIGNITIAIDKTLAKVLGNKVPTGAFGVAILDECHLCPANTIFSVMNNINSKCRFGFSGTLKRKDQKEFLIYSTFGRVIYTIGKEELLNMKRVVPVEVKIIETRSDVELPEDIPAAQSYQIIEKTLANDYIRQGLIVDLANSLPGKTIVLTRLVDPCYNMQQILKLRHNAESGVITGRDSKEAIESYNQMKFKDLKTIFATIGCVSTGVSISDLDNIILASPIYTNELLIHQIRGRLMRTAEGKTHGTLYFIYDPLVFPEWKLNKFLRIMGK